ncbi:MAG: homocysteine S-methyltransferase family protein [Planctomycetaceae bacterium]
MAIRPLEERLQESRPLLLDGATGTELNRRGVDTRLPLWSARALVEATGVLGGIHRDYVDAGADILTANTFRTHRRNLAHAGWGGRACELTRRAVEIARSAADGRAWVVGSQPPLEDCYLPDLVPGDAELDHEHGEMSRNLAAAGVDAILVETQNTIREAVAAVQAARQTALPLLVSFVCGVDGRLLSGESLGDAAKTVQPFAPLAILVNCVPADAALSMLRELRNAVTPVPIGGYANIGRSDPQQGWINTDARDPDCYAAYADSWLRAGARIIGGCCGTTPAHIRRLRALIDGR